MAKRGRLTPGGKLLQLERRRNVANRYMRGEAQWSIARALEINPDTVRQDLRAIRKEWLLSALTDYGNRQAQELAKVDEVERQSWDAWTCSREVHYVKGPDGDWVAKQPPGDPRFLEMVLNCIKRRCEILGVDAPRRAVILHQTTDDIKGLTDAQLVKLLEGDTGGACTTGDRDHLLAGPAGADSTDGEAGGGAPGVDPSAGGDTDGEQSGAEEEGSGVDG